MRSRNVVEAIRAKFPAPPVERLQAMRGVEILERIGNSEAQSALRAVAQKAADLEIREDAVRALDRLESK